VRQPPSIEWGALGEEPARRHQLSGKSMEGPALLARQPERVIDNPAVTMLPDFVHNSRVAITPEAWLAWLPLRRKGVSALSATHAILQAARPDLAKSPRSEFRPETQA